MLFCGLYDRTLHRDEKTGRTVFTVKTDDEAVELTEYGNVVCCGTIPVYPERMPLKLEGEFSPSAYGPTFYVSSCCEHANSREDAIAFLSGKDFPGVGERTAEKIVDIIGTDVFSVTEYEDAEVKLIAGGISAEIAEEVMSALSSCRGINSLLRYVTSHGGNYQNAYAVFTKNGDKAEELLRSDPYRAAEYGFSYSACESLAKEAGVYVYDISRLSALIDECLRLGESAGNTALTFRQICKTAHVIEKRANMGYSTEPFFIGAALIQKEDRFVLFEDEDEFYIVRRGMFDREQSITSHVHWLSDVKKTVKVDNDKVRDIEEKFFIEYAPEQEAAFELLSSPGVKILTGGPGTGKTTVLNGLIAYYREMYPFGTVRLCAPTANAAKRMREATGEPASTVHRLLGLNLHGEIIATSRREQSLPMGLIIIDEASMLDTDLVAAILRCVSQGSILLLVGDEDQLESVGPGNVLADLIAEGRVPVCRLTKVFRQENTSSILENSIRIRRGEPRLLLDGKTELLRMEDGEELSQKAVELMRRCYDPEDPWNCRLLTPVRNPKYPYSTQQLNIALQAIFNSSGEEGVTYGGYTYKIGDPVLFVRNNYEGGYINGDTGIVTQLYRGVYGACVIVDTGEKELEIAGVNLGDIELAYATTVHKSQGSECGTAILVVPKQPVSLLYRRTVYVAATRAKNRNIILSEGSAVEDAILNVHCRPRNTTLGHLLRRSYGTI